MLATLGDLVDDVVVRLSGPVHLASDTAARIQRRRGGSAANVAAAGAQNGNLVRFLGQVGDDALGHLLVDELASIGVDTTHVRRSGTTGSIVVLVDHHGERSMLTDRGACVDLAGPDAAWLAGVSTLHVPLYSLIDPPLSETAATLIEWAHRDGVAVSVDVSSVALIESVGAEAINELVSQLAPSVLFANEDEARALDIRSASRAALTVVKRGSEPALVHALDRPTTEVPAVAVDEVTDTTGAGDAFAAGFLTFSRQTVSRQTVSRQMVSQPLAVEPPRWLDEPQAACEAGHRVAAELLRSR